MRHGGIGAEGLLSRISRMVVHATWVSRWRNNISPVRVVRCVLVVSVILKMRIGRCMRKNVVRYVIYGD